MSRLGRVTPSAGRDVIDRKACFLFLLAQAAVLASVPGPACDLETCPSVSRTAGSGDPRRTKSFSLGGVDGPLNSSILGLFFTSRGPSFSGHGYPTQRAANTSCPRSDRFWLLELRVSRTFLDKLRPQLLRAWIPSSARHRRWTPTIHRGRAQRTMLETGRGWRAKPARHGRKPPPDARRIFRATRFRSETAIPAPGGAVSRTPCRAGRWLGCEYGTHDSPRRSGQGNRPVCRSAGSPQIGLAMP
jgi:hypothetical protein